MLPRTCRQTQARIFTRHVTPVPPTDRFRQYRAVALLEAVARVDSTFFTNGYLVTWGCVTRAVVSRRWCGHTFPDGRAEVNGLIATA